jgi:lipopolysaccharide/colanic/teichoic acid biosynthesis glycosyltransferase
MTLSTKLHRPIEFVGSVMPAERLNAGFYATWLKRPFDIILVLLASPIVLPVVVLLALAVALDGGNPLYSQPRVGRNGRIYRMWKLRSMVPNAEAVLERLRAEDARIEAEWTLMQKLENDPRVTWLGRLLRKSSFDELPQLFNVLRGDMSLVGPRPMMPEQRHLYPCTGYYHLRPGITGPWQVSERNQTTFAERARFDRAYLANLTFAADLSLLLATVRVVLRGTGR